MAYLQVFDGTGRRFELDERATIGRGSVNTIRVIDPYVSRRHAAIEMTPEGELRLVDLGSRHGTYWRGRRVDSVLLTHGDEILIGGTRLRVHHAPPSCTERDAAYVAPAPVGARSARRPDGRDKGPFPPESEISDTAALRRHYELVRAAYQMLRSAEPAPQLAPLLRSLLDTVLSMFGSERGLIMLLDRDSRQPTLTISQDWTGAERPRPIRIATRAVARLVASGRASRCREAGCHGGNGHTDSAAHAAMVAPIRRREEVLGLVYLEAAESGREFDGADLERLATIANQVGLIVENQGRFQALGAASEREREDLDRIFGAVPSGLLLLDAQRRPVFANRLADAWLPQLAELGTGGVLTHLGELTLETVIEATAAGHELELTLPGPPRRVLALSQAPSGDGQAEECLIVLRDVTEQRRRARRRSRRERLAVMGHLAGTIAHDFNNLLSVILSYAVLVSDDPTGEEAGDDLDHLKRAVRNGADRARRLLAFGGRDLLRPEVLDINGVIAEVESLFARVLSTRVVLDSQLAEDLCAVEIDPFALQKALSDLVLNARDAMPTGGRLTIRTANLRVGRPDESLIGPIAPGEYVALEVTDTGVGMDERELERTFEPFHTTKDRGSGLGLATVYGLLKQSGGHIRVESTPGRGTRFQILLPAAPGHVRPASAVAATPRRPAAALGSGRVVLLAEDDPAVRAIARRVLVRAGFQVLTASDGNEALALGEAHLDTIDVLVTDVVMPGVSGAELANALTERRPELRVLFMSGYVGNGLRAEDLDEQRTAFLAKPFGPEDLIERMRRLFQVAE